MIHIPLSTGEGRFLSYLEPVFHISSARVRDDGKSHNRCRTYLLVPWGERKGLDVSMCSITSPSPSIMPVTGPGVNVYL